MGGRELLPVIKFTMPQLFIIFSLLIITSIVMVILSFNPIHSILWLVFVFLLSSGLLISMGIDFIPLMIIIIYVGAITILFLFVIMMLDIIQIREITSITHIIPILIVSSVNVILQLTILFSTDYYSGNTISYMSWSFDNANQILSIASILYSEYFYPLVLLSILLIIAMVGAIALTIELGSITRKQVLYLQHHRNNSWT